MQDANFYKFVLGLLLISWFIVGCATPPQHESDPFENFNRGVFAVNDGVDKIILRPLADTYATLVPGPIDKGVTNFFSNLDDVLVVANDFLQFKLKQAASDSGRFLLNSTVGLLGLFDVASSFGLPKHVEDFGQTLGYWGVGEGPYLVLPLLGPSSVRDTMGLGADFFLDPRFYVGAPGSREERTVFASEAVKKIDVRADLLDAEEILQVAALDKYSFIREAYLARREYLVYDENPPLKEEDDIFDDDDDELEEDDELKEDDETIPNDDTVISEPKLIID